MSTNPGMTGAAVRTESPSPLPCMKLSIVVPAYNETQRIVPTLESIFAWARAQPWDFEVVVVDDGSSDGTAELVATRFTAEPHLRVLAYTPNRGKGHAVRHGLRHAHGEWVLFSDADLSTPIEQLEPMLAAGERGADVVIASRAVGGAEIRERQPFYREAGGKLFNRLVRLLVLPDLHDTQCGFKLFRRSAIAPVLDDLVIDGFAFDVEILALARAAGARIVEIATVWTNSPSSRVRMGAALRAYTDLLGIRRRARRRRAIAADRPAR